MPGTEVGSIFYSLNLKKGAFDKAISSVNGQVDSLGAKFQASVDASKKFSLGIIGLGAAFAGIAVKSTLTAARTETLGVAMEAVAKQTKTSTEVLKSQEAALMKQGITTQQARVTLTKFMQSELDVADAADLARVAQDLAVIAGENSSETTARLTDAIATMNPELLKQVGITTSSAVVFERYAETLGKDVDELTSAEKKQAMLNLIMKEGGKVAGTYEAAMGTAGKKLGSLARYFEEAENAIGSVFLPVFGDMIDAVTNGLKQITPENIEKFVNYLKDNQAIIFAVLGAIAGGMFLAAKAALVLAVNTAVALAPYIAVGAAIGLLIYGIVTLVKNWDNISVKLKEIGILILTTVVDAFNSLVGTVGSVISSITTSIGTFLANLVTDLPAKIGYVVGFLLTLPIKIIIAFGIILYKIGEAITAIDWGAKFSAILNGAKSIFNSIITKAGELLTRIKEKIKAVDWEGIFTGVLDGAKAIFVKIPGILKGILTGAGDIGKAVANAIIGFVEGAIKGAIAGIPGLKGFSNTFSIPRLAEGIRNFAGGLAVVGERGPELAYLPKGASIIPNHALSETAAPSTTINQTFALNVSSPLDIELAMSRASARARRSF